MIKFFKSICITIKKDIKEFTWYQRLVHGIFLSRIRNIGHSEVRSIRDLVVARCTVTALSTITERRSRLESSRFSYVFAFCLGRPTLSRDNAYWKWITVITVTEPTATMQSMNLPDSDYL